MSPKAANDVPLGTPAPSQFDKGDGKSTTVVPKPAGRQPLNGKRSKKKKMSSQQSRPRELRLCSLPIVRIRSDGLPAGFELLDIGPGR